MHLERLEKKVGSTRAIVTCGCELRDVGDRNKDWSSRRAAQALFYKSLYKRKDSMMAQRTKQSYNSGWRRGDFIIHLHALCTLFI